MKNTQGFRLVGLPMLLLSSVTFASAWPAISSADMPQGPGNGRQNVLRGVHEITLEPGQTAKVDDFYCILGATAYLTLYQSSAYPVRLQIYGGTQQTSGRGDDWEKLAWEVGDYATDSSLPLGSDFGFHVTNESHEMVDVIVSAHC
jgi:hypothetical protein